MLTLNDGRSELWQWDTGRTLAVDADCSQVHFSNKVFGRSIDVDVTDGTAIIPDILLQTDKDLNVWAFVGTAENGYTKISKTFRVNRRNKPADYVFTPPEQTTLSELVERLGKLEESQDPDAIKNAVEDYLEKNPVEVPVQSVNGQTGAVELNAEDVGAIADETDPTVPKWAKAENKPEYTAEEVGALSAETLPEAINTAMAQAKASGEFDGADGAPGPQGPQGDTGPAGEAGGWYTPAVTQPDANTIRMSFTPSKEDMPTVEPVDITLPAGGGGTTTHGIVWDLTNVTSSNHAVSADDGASLVAVLTPADGYTLGDVTINMGGEVVTGAWNAETATITIEAVTGDVVISCAGVAQSTGPVDTTAKIAGTGYGLNNQGELYPLQKACYTEFYSFGRTIEGNDSRKVIYYISSNNEGGMFGANSQQVWQDDAFVTYWTTKYDGVYENNFTGNYGPFNRVRFPLVTAYIDDDYAYFADTGEVIFAGKNTPYYGMANIDGTMAGGGSTPETASVMSVDDDYAMDYGVSTLSLVTDESASAATDTGLDVAYAAVIEEAKNAWMVEANGNVDKIPLIIHTDQHGNFSKPLWDTVDKIVDWYEISKVVNLGDTVGHWVDADTDHPLTKNADLENYLESLESVPYSKRIEVFGNHDTWKYENGAYSGLTPQNYLRKYFKNIYARSKDNYGNMVVYDDRYNVKYLIISGMAYDSDIGGYSHYIIPTASWDWIIAQLAKADGYDVVVLSHVALGAGGAAVTDPTGESDISSCGAVDWVSQAGFWTARKNKTSGSFTDQYGISHTYDFSGCDGELLCGLHGHEHADGYCYIGDSLLDIFFDAYYISPNAIHFVLVDRENRKLNVWKVDNTPQVQNYQIPMDKPTE